MENNNNSNRTLVFLNSKHRIAGGISDFVISFADLQISKNKDEEIYVFVVDCVINNSYYNINSRNNSFRVDSTDISIEPGNYNINELVAALKTAIQPTHSHFNISYNKITSRLTISHNSQQSNTINFNVSNSIYKILGFLKQSYTLHGNESITADNITNIGTDICLYLHSNIVNDNLMSISENKGNLEATTVLCKLPLLSQNFSNQYFYANSDLYRQKIPDENLDKLEFRVTNQDFELIDLLNDFVITLCFEVVKKDDTLLHRVNQLMSELVKINKMNFIKNIV